MNKRKNLISSLVIAGILGSPFVGVNAINTNNSTKTEALGIYSSLVKGKNIVPFILQSETDRATIGDLKEKYPNAVIEGTNSTILKTGDKFTLNNVEHEILVYGDVYPDGEVDIFDVMELIKAAKGQNNLSDIQKIAANVNTTDEEIDIFDAMNIVSVIKGAVNYNKITPIPKTEQKEENKEDKKEETKNDNTQSGGGESSSTTKTETRNNNSSNKNYNPVVSYGTVTTGTGNYSGKEILDDKTISIKYTANAVGYSYELKDKNDSIVAKYVPQKDEVAEIKTELTNIEENSNETILHLTNSLIPGDEYTLNIINNNDRNISTQKIKYESMAKATAVEISNKLDTNTTYNKVLSSIANNVSLKITLDKKIENKNVKVILSELDENDNKVREVYSLVNNKTTSDTDTTVTLNGFNVSNFSDGDIFVTVEIYGADGNISRTSTYFNGSKIKITKDTNEFKIVDTNAISSTNITTGKQEVQVTILTNDNYQTINKLYYLVDSSYSANKDAILKNASLNGISSNTYQVTIDSTDSSKQYYIHLIAENANGVQTEIVNEKIEKISTPEMASVDSNSIRTAKFGNFEWTASTDTNSYEVKLYANNNTQGNTKVVTTKIVNQTSVDFTAEIKKFAQDKANSGYTEYTIGIISIAKSGYRNSEEQKSNSVHWDVVQLDAPTINKIVFNNSEQTLNVTNTAKNINNKNLIDQYEVNIYKYDSNGNRSSYSTKSKRYITLDDINLTRDLFSGMSKGKYAVTIKAIAIDFATSHTVDSVESSAINTYYVDEPNAFVLKVIDSNTVNVSINEIANIENVDRNNFKYYAYYKKSTDSDFIKVTNAFDKTLSKDISGLTQDKEYEMYVSVVYVVGEQENEIVQTKKLKITTEVAPLTLVNLVKVENYPKNGEISCKDGKIILYNGTNTYTPSTQIKNYNEILKILQVMSYGDIINSQGDKTIVTKMKSGGELGNALENATLNVSGTIGEVAFNANKIKKIILEDNVNVAHLDKVYNVSEGIVLGANTSVIDVRNGTKLIMNGKTVIVNGVKVTAENGTELIVNSNNN